MGACLSQPSNSRTTPFSDRALGSVIPIGTIENSQRQSQRQRNQTSKAECYIQEALSSFCTTLHDKTVDIDSEFSFIKELLSYDSCKDVFLKFLLANQLADWMSFFLSSAASTTNNGESCNNIDEIAAYTLPGSVSNAGGFRFRSDLDNLSDEALIKIMDSSKHEIYFMLCTSAFPNFLGSGLYKDWCARMGRSEVIGC